MTQEDKTVEEIEAETQAIQEKLKQAKIKAAQKRIKSRKANEHPLTAIQQDQSVKSASGFAGPSLIERIQSQMDKRRQFLEKMVFEEGMLQCIASNEYVTNKGRYEGLGVALSILRATTLREEINRSNERLGI